MPLAISITHMKVTESISLRNAILSERGRIIRDIHPSKNANRCNTFVIRYFLATQPALSVKKNFDHTTDTSDFSYKEMGILH